MASVTTRSEPLAAPQMQIAGIPRVVVNAEPFGFGPAAAIATIAAELRPLLPVLDYLGSGHTLDLHGRIAYDRVIKPEQGELLPDLLSSYDLVVTATDFRVAEAACIAGVPVIIWDMLAWQWPTLPEIVRRSHLYLCQDFFGVAKRLERDLGHATNWQIVPPLLPSADLEQPRRGAIVSLGGIENPFVPRSIYQAAITIMVDQVRFALDVNGIELTLVLGPGSILNSLSIHAATVLPQSSVRSLASSALSIMTPGLANMYEASHFARSVIWLPPLNNTHGAQLRELRERGEAHYSLDWDQIDRSLAVDYQRPQEECMRAISNNLEALAMSRDIQRRFFQLCCNVVGESHRRPRVPGSLREFGRTSGKMIAQRIIQEIHVISQT